MTSYVVRWSNWACKLPVVLISSGIDDESMSSSLRDSDTGKVRLLVPCAGQHLS